MTPDSQDDDRTVIRPAAPAAGADRSAPADDDRTLIRPAGAPQQQAPQPSPQPAPEPAPPPAASDMGNGLPVGTLLGEFELTALLGEGGFGIVYLAIDHSLQRRVALKEYMPSVLAARSGQSQVQVKSERHRETFEAGRKSFVNEARLLAQFDHPSLVKVYRFWEANGTAYMVMPFYEGKTLKDTLRALGAPPDEAWLRTLLDPLTEALAVIHGEQCYHRDIAPDNVMMLAGSNRPLLLDFGAARRVIGDMTQALTVILKPGYAPVEQYAEIPGMKQGPWTDVYALAAVMYSAITGKTPPPSVGRLLNDTYVPLVDCAAGSYSPAFLAAIDRALAVRPELRTQSVELLRAELGLGAGPASGSAGAAAPTAAAPVSAPRPAVAAPISPPWVAGAAVAPPGSRKLLIGAGLLGLAVIAGAYSWLAPASRPAPAATPAPALATTPPAPPAASPPVATALAPAAVAPVAAAASFDVGADFKRVVQAQSPGFGLQASAANSQLRIGRDELKFTVQSDRDGYLYVLALGSDGLLTQLYPNTSSGALKLRKGQSLTLPQPPIVFETTEPIGPAQLLVMVSSRERDHSLLQPRKDGPFRQFPIGADALRLVAAHPSALPLLAGRAICPGSTTCDDEFGAAVIKVQTVR